MLRALDDMKKVLFYGKESINFGKPRSTSSTLNVLRDQIATGFAKESRQRSIDVIHAIIGKATEVGELLEALVAMAFNSHEKFDRINAIEEIGDGLWYDALLLRALNSDFEQAMQINIAKLKSRFPNKFTEHDATNRDLKTEREVLERKP